MIIVDENVDQRYIDLLIAHGHDIYLIRDYHQGISDRQVIELALNKKAWVLTEDKDFGELVFSHNINDCSIILLRYKKVEHGDIAKQLIKVLNDYLDQPGRYFFTITKRKIRFRNI